MSSAFPQTPPEYEHPVDALARELQLERRTHANRPHTRLKVLLFALPFALACTLGPLLLPRDVALTVGSALLGVQLAGPYTRWSRAIVRHFDMARSSYQHPVTFTREATAQLLFHNRVHRTQVNLTPQFNDSGETVGYSIRDVGAVGSNRTVARVWFRLKLEPAWRRYFVDLDGRVVFQDSSQDGRRGVTQCSDLVAEYPMRWRHKGWTGRCYFVLGVLTLNALGRKLRLITLSPDADASVITLSRQLGVPYQREGSRWKRIMFRLRLGWLMLAPHPLRTGHGRR